MPQLAQANPAETLLSGILRPELDSQQAVGMLVAAKGTLAELKVGLLVGQKDYVPASDLHSWSAC